MNKLMCRLWLRRRKKKEKEKRNRPVFRHCMSLKASRVKMPFRVIFSILNNLSLRRNIFLNIRKFTRENEPRFWQK